MVLAFADAAARADHVAQVESHRNPAVEVDLHATAQVDGCIDVVAHGSVATADAQGARTCNEERRHAPAGDLGQDVAADCVERGRLVVVGRRKHAAAFEFDPEEAQRVVADACAELGSDGLETLEAEIRRGGIELKQLVIGTGEEQASVDAQLPHVALGRPAVDPLDITAVGARIGVGRRPVL